MRRSLVIFLLTLAGACAAPEPEWQPVTPGEARFNVVELLPERQLRDIRRSIPPGLRIRTEHFRFHSGEIVIGQTFPGSKLTDTVLRQYGERGEVEAWALTTHRQAERVLSVQGLGHERFRGAGWVVVYALRDSPIRCAAARAYLTIEGRDDDYGLTHDTLVTAVLCQDDDAVPADLRRLLAQLRPRAE